MLERGPATGPLFQAFFAAVQQAGYPITDDVNGYRQEGFAAFDRNIHHGRRLSAARAYLHPVMRRPNLDVTCRAFVTKILFEGQRAVGVEYREGGVLPAAGRGSGGPARLARGAEIILCGGAINTPQLLQLSGVGPAGLLGGLGVHVVADLPGVGENLQDHLEVYVQSGSKQPVSVAPALKLRNRPMVGAKWLFLCSGPGATKHTSEGGGFIRRQRHGGLPQPHGTTSYADRDPLRRLAPRRAGTATRSTSARCTPTRAARSGCARATPPSIRRCGSTTCPPRPTARSGPRPSGSPGTS